MKITIAIAGSQWNKFSKTQIDNDQNSIFERFLMKLSNKDDFTNKNILEVGSGARFTDII